jgi:hypothetical protein
LPSPNLEGVLREGAIGACLETVPSIYVKFEGFEEVAIEDCLQVVLSIIERRKSRGRYDC